MFNDINRANKIRISFVVIFQICFCRDRQSMSLQNTYNNRLFLQRTFIWFAMIDNKASIKTSKAVWLVGLYLDVLIQRLNKNYLNYVLSKSKMEWYFVWILILGLLRSIFFLALWIYMVIKFLGFLWFVVIWLTVVIELNYIRFYIPSYNNNAHLSFSLLEQANSRIIGPISVHGGDIFLRCDQTSSYHQQHLKRQRRLGVPDH